MLCSRAGGAHQSANHIPRPAEARRVKCILLFLLLQEALSQWDGLTGDQSTTLKPIDVQFILTRPQHSRLDRTVASS